MISISLLPREYRQQAKLRQMLTIILLVGGLVILVLLFSLRLLWVTVDRSQKQLDEILLQQQTLEEQMEPLFRYQRLYQQVVNQNEIILEVTGELVEWSTLLHTLAEKVPVGVWLTGFSLAGEDDTEDSNNQVGHKLNLSGKAWDHLLIGRFVEELKSMPDFSRVVWDFSRVNGNSHIQFSISGSFREAHHD